MEIEQLEEISDEEDDLYSFCPICGVDWSDDSKSHTCDKMFLVDRKKPRFYIMDLDNYNDEFLKVILKWQDLKIRALQDIESISPNDVDLKSF